MLFYYKILINKMFKYMN